MTALDQGNEHWWRRPVTPHEIAGVAMIAFGVIATAVTATAIVESYSNLVAFALAYGLHGWRAAIAPLAADAFIVLGELLLFIRVLRHWKDTLSLVAGALMTLWGFILSVGGNVWHAPAATVADRAVSAIWPVTATAGLAGGLIIVKRLLEGRRGPAIPATVSSQAPPPVPALRREPPRQPVRVKARAPGPAAVQGSRLNDERVAVEEEIRGELLERGGKLPTERELAADPRLDGSRRAAARILGQVRSMSNGKHDGDLVSA